jgi:predicted  nucleic acid-binding Zn-ribbon protein
MTFRTLSLLLGFAALSFGRTHRQAQVASGTIEMSALSIERTEGDVRTNEIRDELANLREQRDKLTSMYTEKHSKVQVLDRQIAPLEAALRPRRRAIHTSFI